MSKPRFDLRAVEAEVPPPSPEPAQAREGKEALYARIPTSLNEAVKQLARERSAALRRRVTVNDLIIEALEGLLRR
jgi:hypothetical protein